MFMSHLQVHILPAARGRNATTTCDHPKTERSEEERGRGQEVLVPPAELSTLLSKTEEN